jgi:hypothetical protein
LSELQEAAAKENKITIESVCDELDAAITVAREKGQANAMVSAAGLRAKLAGLGIERTHQQVEIGGPGSFDHMTDPREIALAVVDAVLQYQFQPYDDYRHEDRERLAEQYFACHLAFDEAKERLIKEVAARPRKSSYALPKALPSPYNGKARQY